MMKNRTVLLLLLSLGCVAFLTACSSNEGDPQDVVNDSAEAPTIEATTAPTADAAIPTEAAAIPVGEADASAVESFGNISYIGADFPQLDVYAPAGPGPWPVVVVVHGPGRGREAMKNLSETIAVEGAVVYNTSVLFPAHWDESIAQLACAVRFAQATAEKEQEDV